MDNKKLMKCIACGKEAEGISFCPECGMLMEEKCRGCGRVTEECLCERKKYDSK